MIDVICPADGTLHYADESSVGKTLRCRTCGKSLTVEPEDQRAPVGIKQEPAEPKVGASSKGEPRVEPKTETPSAPRLIHRIPPLLGGAALLAIVAMLLIAFWPAGPPPDSNQVTTYSINPAGRNPSAEPALATVKRTPKAKPLKAKPVLEEKPSGAPPPCAQGREPVRLKTGERIEPDGGTSGASNIQVMNGGGLDAAVKLVDSVTGKTSRFVYVQAGHSFTIEGIETGAYLLQFEYGSDWIPECHQFVRSSEYVEFASPFVFLDDRMRFYEVTLSPVVGGRTLTRRIEPKRFLGGGQDNGISP